MNTIQPVLESHEVDKGSISIGSIPSLPIIITASVVVFAVEATITLLRRHRGGARLITAAEQPQSAPSEPHRSLRCFADKSRNILADVQALEKQLAISISRRNRRTPIRRKRYDRCLASPLDLPTHRSGPSQEFSAFCERLLLTNKIWKQEKELKAIRAASAEKTRAAKDTAFTTFCDQLLLWNRIWKLEREVAEAVREKERVRRERETAVTRAAKRMVQDVQKERMVEEFVKDLIEELGTTKEEMGNQQMQHEREVEKIHEDWLKDYRRVAHELEQLKLAQRARLVEQEVSNSMEESLFGSLQDGQRRVESLEESLKAVGYASSDDATLNGAEASDAESELTTSSTCVSSNCSRRPSLTTPNHVLERKRCISHEALVPTSQRLEHCRSSSVPNTANDIYAVRSLEADQAKSASALRRNMSTATRTCNHSGRPLAIRNRTTSVTVASRTPPTSPFGSTFAKNGGLANRAPWRV